MRLTEHFDRHEFTCNCGCGYDTADSRLVEALEAIRTHFGCMVKITSGCRCDYWNTFVGGSVNSKHKEGRAADIVLSEASPKDVADFAETLDGISVGRYKTFTHVDSRSGPPARWGEN